MEIKDLAGISEPLTRLIEVISQGVGAVSSSYLIRRNADARAYEIRVISAALQEASEQNNLPVAYKHGEIKVWQKPDDSNLILNSGSIDERSNLRLDYQERKRQTNLENVTSVAAAELAGEKFIPEEKPSEDWVARFFGSAQDVSSEQMQSLWGRILAGEIRKPGSYSLRTLELVRNLSQKEAEKFILIGNMAIQIGESFVVVTHNKEWLDENRNITFGLFVELSEIGFLYPSELAKPVFDEPQPEELPFIYQDKLLLVKRHEIEKEIRLPIWKFTAIGQELLSLLQANVDYEYLNKVGEFFMQYGGKAFVGQVTSIEAGVIRYESLREIAAKTSKL
ncbi:DUF2806 domain-containing protein [Leptolyngbya iicbica]|uniref:DUF2806 domain-containing protein n=2 Tax=Cyanophyceae TaxID=3028117 RepID=A0A4Q7E8N2_9CYAN|nr:DUF2806 domain-containing protein [Leptolyngbya sp. LK]RZM77191.1 DUF2806 domain-containing protein [Leptolyngbya sp. LK]